MDIDNDNIYLERRKDDVNTKIDKLTKKLTMLINEKKYLESKSEDLIDQTKYLEPNKRDYINKTSGKIPSRIRSADKKRMLVELNREGKLEDYMKNNPL